MLRPALIAIGAFFTLMLLYSFGSGAVAYLGDPPAATAEKEFHLHPKEVEFSFNGALGHYDRQQLQRGFQVFKEVCSACHSLKFVAFRDLQPSTRQAARELAAAVVEGLRTPAAAA